MKKNMIIKIITWSNVLFFALTTIAWSAPQSYEFDIPEEMGKVVQRYNGESDSCVIHIQDAHTSLEAQKNNARIIEYLSSTYDIDLIGVEGATDEIDYSPVREFPLNDIKKDTAWKFVERGILTGAEYQAIANETPLTLVGVEDKELLWRNYAAFRDVTRTQEKSLTAVTNEKNMIERTKPVLNDSLTTFLTLTDRFFRHELPVDKFLRSFFPYVAESTIDINAYPDMAYFLEKQEVLSFTGFLNDIEHVSSEIAKSLAATREEKEYLTRLNNVRLKEKAITLELIPAEYAAHKQMMSPEIRSFYDTALLRDRVLVDHLLDARRKRKKSTAVLVAGGYHSAGIADYLRSRGESFISIVPVISSTEKDYPSEKRMNGELYPVINPAGYFLTVLIQELLGTEEFNREIIPALLRALEERSMEAIEQQIHALPHAPMLSAEDMISGWEDVRANIDFSQVDSLEEIVSAVRSLRTVQQIRARSAVITAVMTEYDLGDELLAARELDAGREEGLETTPPMYIKTEKGEFVIKKASARISDDELDFLVPFTNGLRRNGFPQAVPIIPTREGNGYIVHEQNRFQVLPFAHGKKLHMGDFRGGLLIEAGAKLADYHAASAKTVEEIGYIPESVQTKTANIIDVSQTQSDIESLLRGLDDMPDEKRADNVNASLISRHADMLLNTFQIHEQRVALVNSQGKDFVTLVADGDFSPANVLVSDEEGKTIQAKYDYGWLQANSRLVDFCTIPAYFTKEEIVALVLAYQNRATHEHDMALTEDELAMLPEVIRAYLLRLVVVLSNDYVGTDAVNPRERDEALVWVLNALKTWNEVIEDELNLADELEKLRKVVELEEKDYYEWSDERVAEAERLEQRSSIKTANEIVKRTGGEDWQFTFITDYAFGGGIVTFNKNLIGLLPHCGMQNGKWLVLNREDEGAMSLYESAAQTIFIKRYRGLDGYDDELTQEEKDLYESFAALKVSAMDLSGATHVFLDDPYMMALAPAIRARYPDIKIICIFQLDISNATEHAKEFLYRHINAADCAIFFRPEYIPADFPIPVAFMHHGINPSNTVNRELTDDPALYRQWQESVLEKYGLDPHKPLVLQVARFHHMKDPVSAVTAFALAKQQLGNDIQFAQFSIPLSDWEKAFADNLRRYRNGLVENGVIEDGDVHIIANDPTHYDLTPEQLTLLNEMGYDTDALTAYEMNQLELNALYKYATILLHPAIFEGFGLVISEAMLAGAVPIGTQVGGLPLQVVNGETGILVEMNEDDLSIANAVYAQFDTLTPDEILAMHAKRETTRGLVQALVDVLSDPERLTRMAQAGREHVRHELLITREVLEVITIAALVNGEYDFLDDNMLAEQAVRRLLDNGQYEALKDEIVRDHQKQREVRGDMFNSRLSASQQLRDDIRACTIEPQAYAADDVLTRLEAIIANPDIWILNYSDADTEIISWALNHLSDDDKDVFNKRLYAWSAADDYFALCDVLFDLRQKIRSAQNDDVSVSSEKPNVVVAVLTRNRANDVISLLGQLEQQQYQNVEIVVMDNGSDDGSLDALLTYLNERSLGYNGPTVTVLHNDSNLGISGGRNELLRHIKQTMPYEYVLMMDDDVEMNGPDFIGSMVRRMQNEEQGDRPAGAISAKRVTQEGDENALYHLGILDEHANTVGRGEIDRGQYDEQLRNEPVSAVCPATALLVPKDVIETIGLFDERFYARGQDYEWTARATENSRWHVYTEPDAVIVEKHTGRETEEAQTAFYEELFKYATRNLFLLWQTHPDVAVLRAHIMKYLAYDIPSAFFNDVKQRSLVSGAIGIYSECEPRDVQRVIRVAKSRDIHTVQLSDKAQAAYEQALELERQLLQGLPASSSVDEDEIRNVFNLLAQEMLSAYGFEVFSRVNDFYTHISSSISAQQQLRADSDEIAETYLRHAPFISAVLPAGQFYCDMYDPVSRRFLAFMALARGEISEFDFLRRDLPDYDFLHVFQLPDGDSFRLERNADEHMRQTFADMVHRHALWQDIMEERVIDDFQNKPYPIANVKLTSDVAERRATIPAFMEKSGIALCLGNPIPACLWNVLDVFVEENDYEFQNCIRDLLIGMDAPLYAEEGIRDTVPREFQINYLLYQLQDGTALSIDEILEQVFTEVAKTMPGRPRHDASSGLVAFSRRHWQETFAYAESLGLIEKGLNSTYSITDTGTQRINAARAQRAAYVEQGTVPVFERPSDDENLNVHIRALAHIRQAA